MTGGILLGTGIGVDLIGIALVSAADWVPDAVEVGTGIRLRLARARAWVLSLFRRHRSTTVHVGTARAVAAGGRVSTLVTNGS